VGHSGTESQCSYARRDGVVALGRTGK
jgi:hypothetical protein